MKTTVYIATTLDGFIARDNGELDWLTGSDSNDYSYSESEDYGFHDYMSSVDVLVMGRNTYDLVISSKQWPYGNIKVIVLSNSLQQLAETTPATVTLKSCTPQDIYTELEASGSSHMYVDGGKTIQGFINAGLVNEITITTIPVLIGKGIPLFGEISKDIKLAHLETRSYKNGFVQSRYRVTSC